MVLPLVVVVVAAIDDAPSASDDARAGACEPVAMPRRSAIRRRPITGRAARPTHQRRRWRDRTAGRGLAARDDRTTAAADSAGIRSPRRPRPDRQHR